MQVFTTILLTMATLLLLSKAVKPLPVLTADEDETSMQELRDLPVEQHEQRKRICGMTWIGCDKNGVSKSSTHHSVFCLFAWLFVCLFVCFAFVVTDSPSSQITMDVTLAHKQCVQTTTTALSIPYFL